MKCYQDEGRQVSAVNRLKASMQVTQQNDREMVRHNSRKRKLSMFTNKTTTSLSDMASPEELTIVCLLVTCIVTATARQSKEEWLRGRVRDKDSDEAEMVRYWIKNNFNPTAISNFKQHHDITENSYRRVLPTALNVTDREKEHLMWMPQSDDMISFSQYAKAGISMNNSLFISWWEDTESYAIYNLTETSTLPLLGKIKVILEWFREDDNIYVAKTINATMANQIIQQVKRMWEQIQETPRISDYLQRIADIEVYWRDMINSNLHHNGMSHKRKNYYDTLRYNRNKNVSCIQANRSPWIKHTLCCTEDSMSDFRHREINANKYKKRGQPYTYVQVPKCTCYPTMIGFDCIE